jgi:hypothetical protein
MIPSAIGQVPLRLDVQLLKRAVTAKITIATNNNFLIVFIWVKTYVLKYLCKDNLPNLNGEILFILHCSANKNEKWQNSA